MSALPRPDLPVGAHRDLVVALHDLHHRAGRPSLRRMATSAGYSHTTVSAVFSSGRLPAWDVLAAVVTALDGDPAEVQDVWLLATTPGGDRPPTAPLVGRREELETLRRFARGGSGLHLILGEAGIGKTRLLEAVAGSHGETVLSARCLPMSRGDPLMPFAAVLRAALRQDDGAWMASAFNTCAPFVRDTLGILLPELDSPGARDRTDEEWAQQRLFVAVSMVLAALSRNRPCVVVLDDLHWADRTSLELVEYLLTATDGPPILGAWRERDPAVPLPAREWRSRVARLSAVHTSWLVPLTSDETVEQLRLIGLDDPETAMRLHARSAGHPLFTEHLARHEGRDDQLPEELADLLRLRIEGLGDAARLVANTLGVMNRPTDADLLSRLVGIGPDEVTAGLRELATRHLLLPGFDDVGLGHPLLCEAVRAQMVATEAVAEHRRVAERLAAHLDDRPSDHGVSAAEVAEHWRGAGDRDAELRWRVRAAYAAQDDWCLGEAADHWFRALDLWPAGVTELDDPPIRRSSLELDALRASFQDEVDRGQQLADDAVAELADRDDQEAGELLHWASQFVNERGDHAGALGLVERALDVLSAVPLSVAHVDALITDAFFLSGVGRESEAADALMEAADLSLRLPAPDRRQLALAGLVFNDLGAGDHDSAAEHLAASDPDPAAADRDPTWAVHVSIHRTAALLGAEAPVDAVAAAAAPGLDAARRWGVDSVMVAIVRCNLATALLRAGRVAEAAALVDHAAAEHPGHRHGPDHEVLATTDLFQGRTSAAVRRAHLLADLPTDCLQNEVEAAEGLAVLELWTGRPTPALDRALDVLERAVVTDAAAYAAPLLTLAARAAADLHADSPGGSDARRTHRRLEELLASASRDPFAPLLTLPARPALAAQWHGELRRLAGSPDPAPWVFAARHWDRLHRPHDAAYCRWRAAQSAAAVGHGTQAARLVRRALADARTHVPLQRALAEELNRVPVGRPGAPTITR